MKYIVGKIATTNLPPTCTTTHMYIWVFPNIGVSQNGWFTMENLIKMDDLRVPPFSETSMYIYIYMYVYIIYANSLHQTVEMWIYLAMANAREGVPSQQIGGLEKFSKISRLFGGSFKCKKKHVERMYSNISQVKL